MLLLHSRLVACKNERTRTPPPPILRMHGRGSPSNARFEQYDAMDDYSTARFYDADGLTPLSHNQDDSSTTAGHVTLYKISLISSVPTSLKTYNCFTIETSLLRPIASVDAPNETKRPGNTRHMVQLRHPDKRQIKPKLPPSHQQNETIIWTARVFHLTYSNRKPDALAMLVRNLKVFLKGL